MNFGTAIKRYIDSTPEASPADVATFTVGLLGAVDPDSAESLWAFDMPDAVAALAEVKAMDGEPSTSTASGAALLDLLDAYGLNDPAATAGALVTSAFLVDLLQALVESDAPISESLDTARSLATATAHAIEMATALDGAQ